MASKYKSGPVGGVIDRAEALLVATAHLSEDKLVDIRKSLAKDLEAARDHLQELEAGVKRQARNGNDLVHDNPWPAVGVAAGAGVLTGVLVGALAFRR